MIKKECEKYYDIRKSHYESRLIKTGRLYLKSIDGTHLKHSSIIYWDMIKRTQPLSWKCELNRRQNIKIKRAKHNWTEEDLLDVSVKPKPSIRRFYTILTLVSTIRFRQYKIWSWGFENHSKRASEGSMSYLLQFALPDCFNFWQRRKGVL